VLGALVLPFAHRLQHVRQFHQCDAQSTAELHGGKHNAGCNDHHHFPQLSSRTPLTRPAAFDAKLVAAKPTLEHDCGPACATCLAGNAPYGFVTQPANVFGDRAPAVVSKPIESACLLSNVCGNLPGQRGPPAVLSLKSFLA